MRRLRWTVRRDKHSNWGSLDWGAVVTSIDAMVRAYAKASMVLRESPEMVEYEDDALDLFTLSQGIWNLLDGVSLAKRWEDAPKHGEHDNCEVCEALSIG